MKYLFLLFFLGIVFISKTETSPVRSSAMPVNERHKEQVMTFKPSAYKKQSKILRRTGRINWTKWVIIFLVLVLAGVLTWGTLTIIGMLKAFVGKILIGIVGAGLVAMVAVFGIVTSAYTTPTNRDHQMAIREQASRRLVALAKQLGVTWLHITTPTDEKCRIGLVTHENGIIIVDYINDQGWQIPKTEIIDIFSKSDDKSGKDQTIQLFTAETKDKNLQNSVQELIFSLKSTSPSNIHIRFTDHFYDTASLISDYKLGWTMQ